MISFVEQARMILEDEHLRPIFRPPGASPSDLTPPPKGLERVLNKALEGKTLGRAESLGLIEIDNKDLIYLIIAAKEVRERAKGMTISYSKNVFIPLTRLCRDKCGYCTFKIEPGEGELFVPPEEVVEIARKGSESGCTELLFVLGDKPELIYEVYRDALGEMGYKTTVEYLIDMCKAGLEQNIFPHSNLGISTTEELEQLRETNPSMGLMLENISPRLLQKGEAHHGCPDKFPKLRMETMQRAGKLRIPWTSGILVGIGETWEERIDSLYAIRDLDEEYGHIQEIIIQNFTPTGGIAMANHYPPALIDMVKTVAIARLIFPDKMNIQVPPNLNLKDYPIFILAGADDLGGVSPLTIDYVNPDSPWPQIEAMENSVTVMGLGMRERLPVYPEYLTEEFVNAPVLEVGSSRLPRQVP